MQKSVSLSGSSPDQQRNRIIIGAIIGVAIIAAIAFILISSNRVSLSSTADLSTIPTSRAADGGFVLGDPNAPVTIVEFADFTCPHCQDYAGTIDRFISEFVVTGKAKFEYRMLRSTRNPYGDFAAQIAECSETLKPGSFFIVHNRLFELTSAGLYDNLGPDIAEHIGIPYGDLLQCTTEATQFVTDSNLGAESGVQGTPAVMVRYGDGPLQWVTIDGTTYNRGGLAFDTISKVVNQAQ